MLTIFGPIQWAFSLLPKWESAWAKWLTRYLTVHFYGAMLYFVSFCISLTHCISIVKIRLLEDTQQRCNKNIKKCFSRNKVLLSVAMRVWHRVRRFLLVAWGFMWQMVCRCIPVTADKVTHFSFNPNLFPLTISNISNDVGRMEACRCPAGIIRKYTNGTYL